MEIDCVFAMYNLKIIRKLRLIHDEKSLKKMMKILLNEQRYNNHFCDEFQMDILLEAILVQLMIQTYKENKHNISYVTGFDLKKVIEHQKAENNMFFYRL